MFQQYHTVGGVFSFFENLLRGFVQLMDESAPADDFDITVFHGRVSPSVLHDRLQWREVGDYFGRFAAESALALHPGRNLDALLFLNYFTPPIVRAKRTVTVIHDLQYCHMPQFFSPVKQYWLSACHRLTLRTCDTVVTISEAVRQDLLNHYGAKWENRVCTIHNPVALSRFEAVSNRQFTAGRPYIMCVAIDRPQKNLFTLIRAFDRLKDRFPDHVLVLAGELRRSRRDRRERSGELAERLPSTEELVKQLDLQDRVVITGFISDADLGALYREASVFVLPSLFEGFGMPAVEALGVGTPTLVSDLPVLCEVTLNSAHYLKDPTDIAAMADAMSAILGDPERYRPSSELIERLRTRFSPPRIAEQYLRILTD